VTVARRVGRRVAGNGHTEHPVGRAPGRRQPNTRARRRGLCVVDRNRPTPQGDKEPMATAGVCQGSHVGVRARVDGGIPGNRLVERALRRVQALEARAEGPRLFARLGGAAHSRSESDADPDKDDQPLPVSWTRRPFTALRVGHAGQRVDARSADWSKDAHSIPRECGGEVRVVARPSHQSRPLVTTIDRVLADQVRASRGAVAHVHPVRL
jgi:hypothetical protein